MCLISLAWQQNEQYPLAIAANRDEFLARSTQEMHFWKSQPDILAGRDLVAGGTWMGFSKQGRFAALTNIRHPDYFKAGDFSRGALIPDYLNSGSSTTEWADWLTQNYSKYHGFNLLFGDAAGIYYFGSHQPELVKLEPGIYGLCNADLNTPWPKVTLARQQMSQWIKSPNLDSLYRLHSNDEMAADGCLPSTGIPAELERSLSAQKISLPEYGTRTQSGVAVDSSGTLYVTELSIDKGNSKQSFTIEGFWNVAALDASE